MAIGFVASSKQSWIQSGASFTLSKPAGISSTDTILIGIAWDTNVVPNFAITGQSPVGLIEDVDTENSTVGLAVLKLTGQSAGGSWTITSALGATSWVTAIAVAYSGVDYDNLVVGSAYSQSTGGADFAIPAITFTGTNNRAVLFLAHIFNNAPRTYSPTHTSHDYSGEFEVSYRDHASSGSTGTVTVTNSAWNSAIGLLIGLQEPSASDPPLPPPLPRTNHRALLIR